MLTFNRDSIVKTRDFGISDLDGRFQTPVSLIGMMPPLGYYPFSEKDDDAVIVPWLLRTLVQLALNKYRGGPEVLLGASFNLDSVLASSHHYWDCLSAEHKAALRNRVDGILMRMINQDPEWKELLERLQAGRGIRVRGTLTQLKSKAQATIDEYQRQPRIDREWTQVATGESS
jgi:hypothetical protein